MQTWKLEIEYEGTRYRGWQIQENARSVMGEIELAAKDFFKTGLLEMGGAGRTDAGVHALSQIAHLRLFKESGDITPRKLQFALNDRLPHDINIRRVQNALPKFHARHDAIARYYVYQIATERTAFAKNFVWWVRDRLDIEAMHHAVKFLNGKHDFYSFCDPPTEAVSTLVQVEKAQLAAVDGMILFRIGANHFLWKMVRRIVGSLVEVGRGNLAVRDFEKLLTQKSRKTAPWTAPPSGLFLERVLYKGDEPPEKTAPVFPIR
jgi:tRNA pseudouridine38-40 synthase